MRYIVWGGFDTRDYDVIVNSDNSNSTAKRNMQEHRIQGRNGSLFVDNGNYLNYNVVYKMIFYKVDDRNRLLAKIRSLLFSKIEYSKLIDSDESGMFRLAMPTALDIKKQSPVTQDFVVNLTFSCKPQRYYAEGEEWLINPLSVVNNTMFVAKPIVKFTLNPSETTFSISVGNGTLQGGFAEQGGTYIHDSENLDTVDENGRNVNLSVAIINNIELLPQSESSIHASGIDSYSIMTRWWTL